MDPVQNQDVPEDSSTGERPTPKTIEELIRENEDLVRRLDEADSTLRAIRENEVDALIVSDQVYTLQSAERPYRLLIEQMQEGAVTVSADGIILYCNPRFSQMVKTPHEKTVAAPFRSFIPRDQEELFESLLWAGAKDNVKCEMTLRAADGATIPVILTIGPLPTEGEGHVCIVATDLTEQKRTGEIIAAEQLARSILDNAAEAIVVCDQKGVIIRANQAANRLCGDKLIDQSFAKVFPIEVEGDEPGEHPPGHARRLPIAEALQGTTVTGISGRLPQEKGDVVYVLASAGPLFGHDGNVIGCVITLTDITERRQLMMELQRALEADHRIAESLQRSLLLKPARNQFPGLEVEPNYKAALDEAQLGGDFFDAFALQGGKVALVVGDVSGKGLVAATRTAEIKFTLRAYLREDSSPVLALSRLNAFLCSAQDLDSRPATNFVCLMLAVVDAATRAATFTGAGMEPPMVVRSTGETEEVPVAGTPLSIDPDARYMAIDRRFATGDIILMVTDGITEARSERGLFGYQRLIHLMRQLYPLESLEQIGQIVFEQARTFAGGRLQDDACLLLTRFV